MKNKTFGGPGGRTMGRKKGSGTGKTIAGMPVSMSGKKPKPIKTLLPKKPVRGQPFGSLRPPREE